MTTEERDFARMSEDLGTTIWRLRETVRVAKLAATHRLEQMRSLLMHERHKVWKREFGYDRIETAAEMDEKRSCASTSPVSNPFLYGNMVIPEHPHTPEEFHLQMKVDVEGFRMEIILSQASSSECDTSPQLVRGQDPRHSKQKRKCTEEFSRLKKGWMVFWIKMSQARSRRSLRCFVNKTSG